MTKADSAEYNRTTEYPMKRFADRLARYAWLVLLTSVGIALIGGGIVAFGWQPSDATGQVVEECTNPPCFGGGGMPSVQDLPWVVSMMGYGLAVLLGLPSLVAALSDIVSRRMLTGVWRLLTSVGLMLFAIGTEIVPHLLNPCFLALEWGGRRFPGMCEYAEWGADFAGRWHLLNHTLVGAIPFATIYWLTLRGHRPEIVRIRTTG